jgi:hypothetical protein
VEALDRLFENVCELDLIFNFETLHAALAEMVVGGVVIETQLERVVEGVKAQGKVAKRPVNESRGGLAGLSMGAGGFGWTGRWGVAWTQIQILVWPMAAERRSRVIQLAIKAFWEEEQHGWPSSCAMKAGLGRRGIKGEHLVMSAVRVLLKPPHQATQC